MSLEILNANWNSIMKKTILPLWEHKFQTMYESAKLDKDDFISMAGEELTKAFAKYNSGVSNIYTYANHVISKKAETELRNCTKRDKRKTLHTASTLNLPISEDNDEELIVTIEDVKDNADTELSEQRVGTFVNSLSNQQLRVLILKLLGFEQGDIPEMLNIPRKTMNDIVKGLKSNELTGILYRRKF